jgi:Protein of unknown function C-terminus (DUF2451)
MTERYKNAVLVSVATVQDHTSVPHAVAQVAQLNLLLTVLLIHTLLMTHNYRAAAHVATACRVALQLRRFIYRCAAPLLTAQDRLITTVETQSWALQQLRNDPSDYVEGWSQRLEWLHSVLIESADVGNGAVGGRPGGVLQLPAAIKPLLYRECVQSVMDGLVEGYARVKKCSTEGRALMSMDLQVML